MLALFLLRSDFAENRVISLYGHSLGTVIIVQALKTLYQFYQQGVARSGRIIFDANLWAGAAVLNPQGTQEEVY